MVRRRRRVYKCIYKFFILFHKNFIFILVLEIVSFDTYSISNRDTLLIVLPAGFFRILYIDNLLQLVIRALQLYGLFTGRKCA